MHELVEGLKGVEVIADDFIIAGFGATTEEAYKSLEQNERSFFTRCREWNLKLNKQKVKRAQRNVPFMGHQLTPEGLKPDPGKIEAIAAMPEPEDATALKRFLGMVNYLSKFMPHLSKMTEPLRRLEDKDVEWQWLTQHSIAFNTVKKYLTESPVLKYYNVNEDVTIQCDASETCLGAVLMQKGQPQPCVTPQEHSQTSRPDTHRLRKNFLLSYGLVISLTSMAETSCTSSLTMSRFKQFLRNLYSSHPNGYRECAWRYKIILWTFSTRKAV